MSLGFVLQSLRNKSRNSSLDSCKSAVAYQEVQLQEERQHDRENESLPTLEACASELAEVEHTNSEMQEEFSNQLKFTKDLPSNQYPKLPLENYPGQMFPGHCNGTVHVNTVSGKMTLDVREKKHENSTALAATQETAQENRTHKRALSRGRGKFNLCSVRRPGFDYREDPTGARQKKVFFRGRPSQEDLSIFEERDASSSTLSRVNSSRIVSEES
ncbi:uncharacterized protein LOC125047422 isoform X2 [Penaeus chinensis]|uniref:uncharacterized protein LOC125047422 isoform X2 n=1 Tax=Penaeus chinensis TaxID=139456 RepID=UPI001FB80168|nr:uncharacterized protein LOC125047422 isoform X2 [Penaeus chinensis]